MDDSSASAVWMSRLETLPLSRGDMNTLVMDYLVTEGYKDAAQVFMLVEPFFKLSAVIIVSKCDLACFIIIFSISIMVLNHILIHN